MATPQQSAIELESSSLGIRRCQVTVSKGSFRKDLVLKEYELCICDNKEPGETRRILLEDLIGVSVLPEPLNKNESGCHLILNEYSPAKTLSDSCEKRTGSDRSLTRIGIDFDSEESFDDNHRVALEWKDAVLSECNKAVNKIFESAGDTKLFLRHHLLVFVCPKSGKGRAENLFKKHVQPLFNMAEINLTVIVTGYRNHAHDVVKKFDLSSIDGIVVVSGDGLVYEVVNGLMERVDWQESIKTPIGVVPAGSGNSLATSTLYYALEEVNITNATFAIIRGGLTSSDIATVQMSNGTVHMSLASSWAMVSDIEIGTEWLRSLGERRYLIGSIKSLAQKKLYHGRLFYLPEDDEQMKPTAANDEAIHGASSNRLVTQEKSKSTNQKINTDLLPSLSDPVPTNWKCIEEQFTTFHTELGPFYGQGDLSLPFGSGKMLITYFTEDCTRSDLLHAVLTYKEASYLKMEKARKIQTKAYRLEPLSPPGYIAIDGEQIEYGPYQVQIQPKMIRFMTRIRREKNN